MMDGGWQDHLIYHIASGQAFFVGSALVLLGLVLAIIIIKRSGFMVFRNVPVFVGAILVAVSATPFPCWFYAVLGLTTLVWLLSEWLRAKVRKQVLIACRLALLVCWFAGIGTELPYHMVPTLPALGRPELFVIGDSVTAGLGERKEVTWPALLAREHDVIVHDFSHVGATVLSAARKQAIRLEERGGLVLLEIGGNDLLGSTAAPDFRKGLDQLLSIVCRPGRTVVMFELPLPPFRNEFGRIQRGLAADYGVTLIPKRIFLAVLMTPGATVDGVHLSPSGHQLMRDAVWELVEPAYNGTE
jgi:acyl-CoA thioesterase-1